MIWPRKNQRKKRVDYKKGRRKVGKPGKLHLSNSGESTCDESGFKGVLNGIGRTANTSGSVVVPTFGTYPIDHTVDSTDTYGDGFSARGTLNAMLCEATSGQRP